MISYRHKEEIPNKKGNPQGSEKRKQGKAKRKQLKRSKNWARSKQRIHGQKNTLNVRKKLSKSRAEKDNPEDQKYSKSIMYDLPAEGKCKKENEKEHRLVMSKKDQKEMSNPQKRR